MSATALYRALVDAGANEDLAKEAVENVVYAPEAATRSDIAELRAANKADLAEHREATRSDIAELRAATRADLAEHREATKSDIAELRGDFTGLHGIQDGHGGVPRRSQVRHGGVQDAITVRHGGVQDGNHIRHGGVQAITSDMAEFKSEIRTDIAEFRVDVERGFRGMTWRFVGLLVATQTLLFAALRMTGAG